MTSAPPSSCCRTSSTGSGRRWTARSPSSTSRRPSRSSSTTTAASAASIPTGTSTARRWSGRARCCCGCASTAGARSAAAVSRPACSRGPTSRVRRARAAPDRDRASWRLTAAPAFRRLPPAAVHGFALFLEARGPWLFAVQRGSRLTAHSRCPLSVTFPPSAPPDA
ncbi:exported hypothetical protein [Frankia sp. Hr75.2]|nr:exported hypothetical protein [Frankia sp. Hr75.2]